MSRRTPQAPRTALSTVLALFVLRVWVGAFFLDAVYYKVVAHPQTQLEEWSLSGAVDLFVAYDFRPRVEAAIADPPEWFGVPVTPYVALLESVMLPNASFFGPFVLVAEALLGISFVLGAGVRLSGVLGFAMMVAFGMVKRLYVLTFKEAHWPITFLLLALALLAAGRAWGLDAWLRRRLPRWIAWAS